MEEVRSLAWLLEVKDKASSQIDKVNRGVTKLRGGMHTAQQAVERAGKSVSGFGSKIQGVGGKLAPLSAFVSGIGIMGTKAAMGLEDVINKIGTLADSDILPKDKIKKELKEISKESGIAQDQLGEAVYSALSSGVDSAEVMDFIRSGIDLTRAGFTDMDTAIDATTTVLNAYGDKAYEVSKIHDIFVQTQDKGKVTVDELGQNIGRVIPAASSLGVNIDQLGASYAILTARGQNVNIATTNLSAMFNELGKTGSTADKTLRSTMGKSFAQLTEEGHNTGEILGYLDDAAKQSGLTLKDMFGATSAGAAAMTLLSEGVEGFNRSMDDMDEATGKTAKNAKELEGDSLTMTKAWNDLKNASMEMGEAFAPVVATMAEKVSILAEKFSGLDDDTKNTIFTIAGLIAVSAPLLSLGGKLISGAGLMITGVGKLIGIGGKFIGVGQGIATFLGGPLTIGIAAVVAGGVLLYKNWDKVKEKAGELKDGISKSWENIKTKTAETWDNVKSKVGSTMDTLSSKWENFKNKVSEKVSANVNFNETRTSDNKSRNHYAVGATRIHGDQNAKLHDGETVLPKRIAKQYRELGGTRTQLPFETSSKIEYSPSINININGNADNNTVQDIKDVVRREFDLQFKKINLKFA